MYFKALNKDRSTCHGGDGVWNPPGEWMPKIETLVSCESGYHICEEKDLVRWLGATIWEVETRGKIIHDTDKSIAHEARLVRQLKWDKIIAVKFACDCAEHVLRHFEAKYPDDKRPHDAIKKAREWAQNPDNSVIAKAVHPDVAAQDGYAAHEVANAVKAAYAAADAAAVGIEDTFLYNAVYLAAHSAAWAYAAHLGNEIEWQTQRLLDYLYERI